MVIRGVAIHNYRMVKTLDLTASSDLSEVAREWKGRRTLASCSADRVVSGG
jgi:hypothetical protein